MSTHFNRFMIAIFLVCGSMQPSRAESADMATSRSLEPIEISASDLERRLAVPRFNTILFDTRSRVEFDVSHLKSAIWLNPEISPATFLATLGPRSRGAYVVFYCTMSQRSMAFALRILDGLEQKGVRRVAVLKGGIIAWANASRELIDVQGTTKFVNPNNSDFMNALSQPELARFSTTFAK